MTDYMEWRGFGLAEPAQMYELDNNGTGNTKKPVDPALWGQALTDYLPKSGGDYYALRDIKGRGAGEHLIIILAGPWDGPLPQLLRSKRFTQIPGNDEKMLSDSPAPFSTNEWESFDKIELFRTIKPGETEPVYTLKIKLQSTERSAVDMKAAAYWCWR